MDFICSCGNKSKINFERFRKIGRCLKCVPKKNIENLSGDKHYNWNPNRVELAINQYFRKRCCSLVKKVLKSVGGVKDDRTFKLLGYDSKQLKKHIHEHPNWEKLKDGDWHLDHIFPIKAFVDYGISDLKIINALDNLQPLSGYDNLSKNCKYDKLQFENWLKSKNILQ